jgi:hypothetical protein
MKGHNIYTVLGFKALKRAAIKAAENARKNNLKIPIWKNGKVEYLAPWISAKQRDGEDEKLIS